MMPNKTLALAAYKALPGSAKTLHHAVDPRCWEIVVEASIEELAKAEADPKIRLEHGHDAPELAHRVWDRTRSQEYAPGRKVEGPNPYGLNVVDISSPVDAIERIIRVLCAAGSAEKTLVASHTALGAQLQVFRRLRQEAQIENGKLIDLGETEP